MSEVLVPYVWKKYANKDGSTRVSLARIGKKDPRYDTKRGYHVGRFPKGAKIKKDILNTQDDVKDDEAKVTQYTPNIAKIKKLMGVKEKNFKPEEMGEVDMKEIEGSGFLSGIPILGPLLSSIFGDGYSEDKLIKGGIKASPEEAEMIKKVTRGHIAKMIDHYGDKNTRRKMIQDMWKTMASRLPKEGGLLTLPFRI